MSVVWCPVCENAEDVPLPEWADDGGVTEELCEACALELHGDDESRVP